MRPFVGSAVGNSLAAPFAAVAWTLTYFRLRDHPAGGGRALVGMSPRRGRAGDRPCVAALALLAVAACGAACGGERRRAAGTAPATATAAAAVATLTSSDRRSCSARDPDPPRPADLLRAPAPDHRPVAKPYRATLETSCGDIVIRLDPKRGAATVNNFVFLAREGFYDGLTFHRVVPGFVIQGGDPDGNGSGGPGYTFADELPTTATRRLGRDGQLGARHQRVAVLHRHRRRLGPAERLLEVRPRGRGPRRRRTIEGFADPTADPARPLDPGPGQPDLHLLGDDHRELILRTPRPRRLLGPVALGDRRPVAVEQLGRQQERRPSGPPSLA